MGFLSMLAILFIGLKLAGIITWQWHLVILPIVIVFIIRAQAVFKRKLG